MSETRRWELRNAAGERLVGGVGVGGSEPVERTGTAVEMVVEGERFVVGEDVHLESVALVMGVDEVRLSSLPGSVPSPG